MSKYCLLIATGSGERKTVFKRFDDEESAKAAARVVVGGDLGNGVIRWAQVNYVDGGPIGCADPRSQRYAVALPGVAGWRESRWSLEHGCWVGVAQFPDERYRVEFAGGISQMARGTTPAAAIRNARDILGEKMELPGAFSGECVSWSHCPLSESETWLEKSLEVAGIS